MNVIFSKAFKKDLLKVKDVRLKKKIKAVIISLENEKSLQEIPNCIKVKGHPTAYRIRIGDYRLGFYFAKNEAQIARFAKRSDIYKLFP